MYWVELFARSFVAKVKFVLGQCLLGSLIFKDIVRGWAILCLIRSLLRKII